METLFFISYFLLLLVVLAALFLLFGVLRQLGMLNWRLEQQGSLGSIRWERSGVR